MNKFGQLVILLSATLLGCGGGGAPTTGGDGVTNATALVSTSYVDGARGQDSALAGSMSVPYKTITYALSVARGNVINIASGRYDSTTGEVFPIILDGGTILVGAKYDVNREIYPDISGCGSSIENPIPASIVVKGGAQIKWLKASCLDGMAVYLKGSEKRAIMDSVLIEKSAFGVVASGLSGVFRSTVRKVVSSGVEFRPGADSDLISNTISDNGVGVTVNGAANINFTLDGSNSINVIRSNFACDLRHIGDSPLDASGTVWDDDPYSFNLATECKDGVNISTESLGSVTYQPKIVSDSPFFNVARSIQLSFPIGNKLIDVVNPSLQWTSGGSRLSAAAIFIKPPVLKSGKISNLQNSVWYWHSGLPSGSSGSVRYSDGVSLVNGGLIGAGSPANLINGGTYYWIAWEWSDNSGEIVAASPVGVFRVRP